MLSLYNDKRSMIRDPLIQKMGSMEDLEEYVEKTDDMELSMMVEIVKEYGNEIPSLIKAIKNKHVDDGKRESADVIFSTVHKSKGMEYDIVHLVNDFMTEERLQTILKEKPEEGLDRGQLNEEINLVYVAVTRAKKTLHIPEDLLPAGLKETPHVKIIDKEQEGKISSSNENKGIQKQSYQKWTPELDEELADLFDQEMSLKEMAAHFGRTKGAIMSRIKKLGLREERYL